MQGGGISYGLVTMRTLSMLQLRTRVCIMVKKSMDSPLSCTANYRIAFFTSYLRLAGIHSLRKAQTLTAMYWCAQLGHPADFDLPESDSFAQCRSHFRSMQVWILEDNPSCNWN